MKNVIESIPVYNLANLENEVKKVNRKAEKLGLNPVTLTIGEKFQESIKIRNREGKNITLIVDRINVKIEGEKPVISGWNLIAKIDHIGENNIISHFVESMDDVPLEYRDAANNCDHCNYNRNRLKTYILQNVSNEDYKQIGSSCVRDYTGDKNADSILWYFDAIPQLADYNDNEDDFLDGFGSGRVGIDLKKFIAICQKLVSQFGFVGTKNYDTSTKFLAIEAYFGTKGFEIPVTESEIDAAQIVLDAVKNYLDDKKSLSDYEHNIYTICGMTGIAYNLTGYAASIIALYNRIMGGFESNPEKPEKIQSEYIGEIGEKLENLTVKFSYHTGFDTRYGWTNVYKFLSGDNILVWFSTVEIDAEIGDNITIKKCTIKNHDTYNGDKQTIITRAKIG